ncbi:MAG: LysR family transcriptional regulator [Candidatus Nezhaarchaeales archaeon]
MSSNYDLKLSHIRTFLIAVEHNSFREAAKRLGLTVATVSNHIAALESFLGIRLFERGARGIKLTTEGQRVYAELKRLIEGLMEIREKIKLLNTRASTITIASMELSLNHIVPCVISRFKKEVNPDSSFMLKRGDEAYCIKEVEEGKSDVAFIERLHEAHSTKDLEFMEIARDRLVIISPLSWRLTGRVDIKEILEKPIIICDLKTSLGELVKSFLEANGLNYDELDIKAEFPSISSVLTAVSQELGLTIAPLTSIRGLISHYDNLKISSIKAKKEHLIFYAIKAEETERETSFWSYLAKLKDEAQGMLPCIKKISERIWKLMR